MQTPAELGVTSVLVGATCVIARVQLVAALGHGWDTHIHLAIKQISVLELANVGILVLLFEFPGHLFNSIALKTYSIRNRNAHEVGAASIRFWHLVVRAWQRGFTWRVNDTIFVVTALL